MLSLSKNKSRREIRNPIKIISHYILFYMKARNVLLFIACTILILQCKSGGNKAVSLMVQPETVNKDTSARITYLLPSPDEVLSEILTEKIFINPQLVNPRTSVVNYVDKKSLAINLGVYIADFAYLNLNSNKTNSLEYFKLIRDLCQKQNITGIFNETFFNRVQINLMNNDSLNLIAREMYSHLSEIMATSNRLEDYAMISSGAIIESLYLSAMSIPNYSDYRTIVKKLFEQNLLLDNYYDFASQFKSDKDVHSVLVQLDSIKIIFNLAGKKSIGRTVSKDKQHHLIISGGDEIITDEMTFKRFVKSISKARLNIIQY
jgi:hypothetical protein